MFKIYFRIRYTLKTSWKVIHIFLIFDAVLLLLMSSLKKQILNMHMLGRNQ